MSIAISTTKICLTETQGRALRAARGRASQGRFGHEALGGLSQFQVSKLETGKTAEVTADQRSRIEHVIGSTLAPESGVSFDEVTARYHTGNLAEAMRILDTHKRADLREHIERQANILAALVDQIDAMKKEMAQLRETMASLGDTVNVLRTHPYMPPEKETKTPARRRG